MDSKEQEVSIGKPDCFGEDNIIGLRVCPLCGKQYTTRPAVSRDDNETLICPDCGIRQALSSIGISKEEQEQIIASIHGES